MKPDWTESAWYWPLTGLILAVGMAALIMAVK
jgi:hypothetical protein